ncbi:TonB family protein [Sphingomonas azotifigens]|uniref:TonB family protein n=1 Tax=Sphingomonas azotifigens TaxID=330920 RepID=UPI000A01ADF0|nr:TonB family protein [Sphingomonas azotifigens]
MFFLMTLLAVQAQSEIPLTQAKPRTTTPWITNDDYPAEDARQHHEGTVGFTLQIDASGRATKCDVVASSGYPGLDNGACFLLMRRARFDPARDASGKAVASTFAGRFTWKLGKTPPTRSGVSGTAGSEAPPPPTALEVSVAALPAAYKQPAKAAVRFGADHRVSDCRIVESSGSAAVDRAACAQLRALASGPATKGTTSGPETETYTVSFRTDPPAKP